MQKVFWIAILLIINALQVNAQPKAVKSKAVFKQISRVLRANILRKADSALLLQPITVTTEQCERSAGGQHDFYSEGDYWWQNPDDPNGAYIQRDGQSNPNNFVAHRRAMVRFSQIIGVLASAYRLTKEEKYAIHAFKHCHAWFVDTATYMTPALLYAQAIKGKATGRGIGIIDMIQMMEVAQGIRVMEKTKSAKNDDLGQIKAWFSKYLTWVTTHQYGIDEREAKNNHGTCWVMQVAVFAQLVGDETILNECRNRFKVVLLPNQLAKDGSFPLELRRTKPYGYALFNLDAMTTLCHILSDKKHDLWNFTLTDGQSMKTAVDFMFPFVADKNTWTFPKDVMYWDEWPIAHPFLLFNYQQFGQKNRLETWQRFEHFPQTEEVIRNLPIRFPLIWF